MASRTNLTGALLFLLTAAAAPVLPEWVASLVTIALANALVVLGLVVITPQFFLEDYVGTAFPPPITHPEHFYGFVAVGFVWQLMFLLIASDPIRYRPAMIIAVLEKVGFGVPCVALYLLGRVPPLVLLAALFDLGLAAAFIVSYRVTPKRS